MRGIIIIALGGIIQIPATLNGSIPAAIVLGFSLGAMVSVLTFRYVLGRTYHDR